MGWEWEGSEKLERGGRGDFFKKKISYCGLWQQTPLVKHSLCKGKGLSLDSQSLRQIWAQWEVPKTPVVEGADKREPGVHWTARLAKQV